jgi:site-specific recombinase
MGAPLVGEKDAHYVLHSLTLLGPAPLFAAFTGVLLFASSLIAGWAENWFVFHQLDSALRWNPRIVARLGAARARRWALWWRANVSGVAANVSLGMMLGLVPAVAAILGLPLEVRHVTLSTGQLGAALGALGWPLLAEPAFWWCVAGIAVTGVLNVGVSFWLAFKVAMRSRGVRCTTAAASARPCASDWQRIRCPSSGRRASEAGAALSQRRVFVVFRLRPENIVHQTMNTSTASASKASRISSHMGASPSSRADTAPA